MLLWAAFMVLSIFSIGWLYEYSPKSLSAHFLPYIFFLAAMGSQFLLFSKIDWIAGSMFGSVLLGLHGIVLISRYRRK
jgi:hypothetical protein